MERNILATLMAVLLLPTLSDAQTRDRLTVSGLELPVEIITDRWGVSHIYAETETDLFFAQGFSAARDRLFQLEIWRRQATGTVAEILGPRELRRDIGTRLFRFRGDIFQEMNHYHARGEVIIRAFVAGINAYIERTERDPTLLPMEFELLGITPGRWTPYVVISRHQGLLGNIGQELNLGRAVVSVGDDLVKQLSNFQPGEPDLSLDASIDGSLLSDDILGIYNAFRRPIRFRPDDIVVSHQNDPASYERLALSYPTFQDGVSPADVESIGSNNWVVDGSLSQSGYPMMANDPHRAQSAPSLRYMVHLIGPGWDVIGGGEPEIPGVSIGHNGHGAWGLTVFSTDGEDLYVYETNPNNPNQYRYRDRWETMSIIRDTIAIRGGPDSIVDHKYTRHGPVVYENVAHRTAYAVRAAWMEVGGSPYLASLRMDQAKTWEEFRVASDYSHIPGENMVWADRDGNIGWQAVGIAPIRRHWSGLVPVPGDGRYEWDGYLPINQKPNIVNPNRGFFVTANNNLIPLDYPHRNAVGWSWSDPFRWSRITEVLGSGRRRSIRDMMDLAADYLSIPARSIVPMLAHVETSDANDANARQRLLHWDYNLEPHSVAAGIYVAMERRIQRGMHELFVPSNAHDVIRSVSMTKIVDWLNAPPGQFGDDPIAGRDEFLARALTDAVSDLRSQLGSNMDDWQLGQSEYKHVLIRHPLSAAVNDEVRRKLDVGPHPRGGNSYTVNNTGRGNNQTSGPSFRIIVDTGDWELQRTHRGRAGIPMIHITGISSSYGPPIASFHCSIRDTVWNP